MGLKRCVTRFKPLGYRATLAHLEAVTGSDREGWTGERLIHAIDLLEATRRRWLVATTAGLPVGWAARVHLHVRLRRSSLTANSTAGRGNALRAKPAFRSLQTRGSARAIWDLGNP